jgi:hypothetical protein
MISYLRHVLAASYLYAQNTTPLGHWSAANSAWTAILLLEAILAWRWMRQRRARGQPVWAARFAFWSGLTGPCLIAVHWWTGGVLSARIGYLSVITLALLTPPLTWLAYRPWPNAVRTLARALACARGPQESPLPLGWQIGLGIVHSAGLYALTMRAHLGGWPVGLCLACLALAVWAQTRSASVGARLGLRVELLTALVFPYISFALRWLIGERLEIDVLAYQAFPYPDIWSPLFDLRAMAGVGLAGVLLSTGAFVLRVPRTGTRSYATLSSTGLANALEAEAWLGLVLLVASLAWYGVTVATHLSHGATGSDPYCYLQMVADLVEHGTVRHDFPLLAVVREAGLPLWPVVHVGYRPPAAGTLAVTVWPGGWPVLLAPLYVLGGVRALMWGAPLWAMLAALLTWALACDLCAHEARGRRWLIAGLAAAITLTSREAVLRSLVPMADAAVQALSVLVLLALVRAHRRDALGWSVLAGAALGLVYDVRHPQLFLGLAALPVYLAGRWSGKRRAEHVAAFAGAALFIALPDLFYHAVAFGSPWITESPEWALLSWRNILPMAQAMWREGFMRRGEFGYLLPWILYGIWRQVHAECRQPGSKSQRDAAVKPTAGVPSLDQRAAAMLWLGLGGVLLFNLGYSALRLRDLISLFPWLGLWAGWGMVALWERANSVPSGRLRHRVLALALILMALGARTPATLQMPWEKGIWTFGYVTAAQRGEYARLGDNLPAEAVVATGLGSGAVECYTGHQAIRPFSWSNEEFTRCVQALATMGRSLYILDDGEEMAGFLARVQGLGTLHCVGEFDLPTFGWGGEDYDQRSRLYVMTK